MSTKHTFTTVWTTLVAITLSLAIDCLAQTNLVTPAQYLASRPRPNFAPGNHLPVLTQWGWVNVSNAVVELANNWGYALPLQGWPVMSEATNPAPLDLLEFAMISNNPAKYKLQVSIDRTFTNPPAGFYCTNSAGSNVLDGTGNISPCPEGPDSYWTNITAYWIRPLKIIQSNAPIGIILNGGEYGLNVPAFGWTAWNQDPRVQASSVMTNPFAIQTNNVPGGWLIVNTNGMSWPDYGSQRKGHQLGFLTSAIRQNFPNRQLYVFYHTDNELGRTWDTNSLNDQYEMYFPGNVWEWWSDYMNTNTDEPSFQFYYASYQGGVSSAVGCWTNVPKDFLTTYLNQIGYNFRLGYSNNYCWIHGGNAYDQADTNLNDVSDIPRYTGFLKCLYMGGMNGAIEYYGAPITNSLSGQTGFDASFPSNSPPNWLQQVMALSYVHALYSQLEPLMDNSDLISGPQVHTLSQDQPAYEFTNTAGRVWQDRVLARKVRNTNQWLICAWAADSVNTNVTVTIPTLGPLTVLARDSGAVYLASTTNMFVYRGSMTNLLPEEMPFPSSPQVSPGSQ